MRVNGQRGNQVNVVQGSIRVDKLADVENVFVRVLGTLGVCAVGCYAHDMSWVHCDRLA